MWFLEVRVILGWECDVCIYEVVDEIERGFMIVGGIGVEDKF